MVSIGMMSFAHVHGPSYASSVKALPNCVLAGVADANEARGRKMAQE